MELLFVSESHFFQSIFYSLRFSEDMRARSEGSGENSRIRRLTVA